MHLTWNQALVSHAFISCVVTTAVLTCVTQYPSGVRAMLNASAAKVLATLLSSGPVSGEDMAAELRLSRAAIWKHVESLRQIGYVITSRPGEGYEVTQSPDLPLQEEVHRYITPQTLGQRILFMRRCDSSNLQLKLMAEQGEKEGTVVVTDEQTAGRGRRGRTWLANPGDGLLFSVLLRPPLAPRELFGLTLVTGVAVAEGLLELGLRPGIKWPNDILIEGKKLCGILAESSGEVDHTHHVILGIGLNVRGKPALDHYGVTALSDHLNPPPRAKILAVLIQNLSARYAQFLGGDLLTILERWKELSITLGQHVVAHTATGEIHGVAKDITREGGLVLLLDSGEQQEVTAGEVTLRPPLEPSTDMR